MMDTSAMMLALGAADIGIWTYVPETETIDVHHRSGLLPTLNNNRFTGPLQQLKAYVLPEDQAALMRLHIDCLNGAPRVQAELRFISRRRPFTWLSLIGQRQALPGEPVRYIGTLRDITEDKLRDSRLKLHQDVLLELARNPVVVNCVDFNDAVSYVIKRALDVLGVSTASCWHFNTEQKALVLRNHYVASAIPGELPLEGSVDAWPVKSMALRDYPVYFATLIQQHRVVAGDVPRATHLGRTHRDTLLQARSQAMLDIAIMQHGNIWGAVSFVDQRRTREWDGETLTFAGAVVNLLSLALEVAERNRSEAELLQASTRHRAFAQVSHDSIWSIDIDEPIPTSLSPQEQIARLRATARISDANRAFARDYNKSVNEVIGQQWSSFMPELFKGTSLLHWIERNYSLLERELRMRTHQDEHWLSLTLLGVIEDGHLVRVWGARRNITDRKRHQAQLEQQAYKDPLTGLLNRQRLIRIIGELLEAPAPLPGTLIELDLNLFKDINDTLGHSAGDEILRQMRDRLETALSPWREGALIARLGGDEFGVYVNGVGSPETAQRMGQAIQRSFDTPFAIGADKYHLSASIGVALYPAHGKTYSELTAAADEAMYHAKQSGSGLHLFSPDVAVFENSALGLITQLPRAIERGELELEYQPIIDTQLGHTVRMEALVRWDHPEHGRLSTQDFVHKAEMSDAIRVLTRWVIEQAVQHTQQWQSIAPGVGVSINISPRLLGDNSIIRHLHQAIERHNLPAFLIDLEITETAAIPNTELAVKSLTDCKLAGFSITMDDYGAAHCSLAYLRQLPLNSLKIDQSFISHLNDSFEDATIVQSTIALAHSLGLTVVAEGVENDATLHFLVDQQCDFAQGFHIAHPLPIASAMAWLHQHSRPGSRRPPEQPAS